MKLKNTLFKMNTKSSYISEIPVSTSKDCMQTPQYVGSGKLTFNVPLDNLSVGSSVGPSVGLLVYLLLFWLVFQLA